MKSLRRGSCASTRYGSGDSPGGIALSALAIHLPLHFDLPTRLRRETRPRRTGRTPRGYPRPHGGRRPDSARDAALPMAFLDSCDRSDSGARRGDMRLALYQPDIAGHVGTILALAARLRVGVDLMQPMDSAFPDRATGTPP